MAYTDQQIGQALKHCREKFLRKSDAHAAIIADVHPTTQYRRENGTRGVSVVDLLGYVESWDVDPIEFWVEFLSQCGKSQWQPIAEKLSCTIPMAQRRFKAGQKRYGLEFGQLWMLVKAGQVDI